MRPILFLIGGIVIADIVTATFFWPPTNEQPGKREPIVNSATRKGQDPWMVNERYNVGNREFVRKGVLETIDTPWVDYCSAKGHKRLIGAINYYFDRRNAQAQSYGQTYGEDARRFATQAWMTPDDNRIERLMSETYGRGYFSLDELQADARTAMAALVKGDVGVSPCAD